MQLTSIQVEAYEKIRVLRKITNRTGVDTTKVQARFFKELRGDDMIAVEKTLEENYNPLSGEWKPLGQAVQRG